MISFSIVSTAAKADEDREKLMTAWMISQKIPNEEVYHLNSLCKAFKIRVMNVLIGVVCTRHPRAVFYCENTLQKATALSMSLEEQCGRPYFVLRTPAYFKLRAIL
eukprot:IDg8372t1